MDKLCCDEQALVHTCDSLRCDVKLYARVQRIRLCLHHHVQRLVKVKGGRLQAYVDCLGSDNTKKPPRVCLDFSELFFIQTEAGTLVL